MLSTPSPSAPTPTRRRPRWWWLSPETAPPPAWCGCTARQYLQIDDRPDWPRWEPSDFGILALTDIPDGTPVFMFLRVSDPDQRDNLKDAQDYLRHVLEVQGFVVVGHYQYQGPGQDTVPALEEAARQAKRAGARVIVGETPSRFRRPHDHEVGHPTRWARRARATDWLPVKDVARRYRVKLVVAAGPNISARDEIKWLRKRTKWAKAREAATPPPPPQPPPADLGLAPPKDKGGRPPGPGRPKADPVRDTVAHMIRDGDSNRKIADTVKLSSSTIRDLRRDILITGK